MIADLPEELARSSDVLDHRRLEVVVVANTVLRNRVGNGDGGSGDGVNGGIRCGGRGADGLLADLLDDESVALEGVRERRRREVIDVLDVEVLKRRNEAFRVPRRVRHLDVGNTPVADGRPEPSERAPDIAHVLQHVRQDHAVGTARFGREIEQATDSRSHVAEPVRRGNARRGRVDAFEPFHALARECGEQPTVRAPDVDDARGRITERARDRACGILEPPAIPLLFPSPRARGGVRVLGQLGVIAVVLRLLRRRVGVHEAAVRTSDHRVVNAQRMAFGQCEAHRLQGRDVERVTHRAGTRGDVVARGNRARRHVRSAGAGRYQSSVRRMASSMPTVWTSRSSSRARAVDGTYL